MNLENERAKERKCEKCGEVSFTTSGKMHCVKCSSSNRSSAKAESERAVLESLGYTDIQEPTLNKFSQRMWTFTHTCGNAQTWTFGNLQTRLKKDSQNVPCSKCGASRRTSSAIKANAKH